MLHKSQGTPAENPHHYRHNFLDKPPQQHELLFILRSMLRFSGKVCGAFSLKQMKRWICGWGSRPAGIHSSYSIQKSQQMIPFHFPFLHFIVRKKNLNLNQLFLFRLNLSFPSPCGTCQGTTLTQNKSEQPEASVPLAQLSVWCVYFQWICEAGRQAESFLSHTTCRAPVSRYHMKQPVKTTSARHATFFSLQAQVQLIKTSMKETHQRQN